MSPIQLTEAERVRRDKIVAQLASDTENTIIVAMNVLKRMAAVHRIPVYEYLGASAASSTTKAHAAEDDQPVDLPADWHKRLTAAWSYHQTTRRFLDSWQRQFVPDLLERGVRRPSAKQALHIARILERFAMMPKAQTESTDDWEDVE